MKIAPQHIKFDFVAAQQSVESKKKRLPEALRERKRKNAVLTCAIVLPIIVGSALAGFFGETELLLQLTAMFAMLLTLSIPVCLTLNYFWFELPSDFDLTANEDFYQ